LAILCRPHATISEKIEFHLLSIVIYELVDEIVAYRCVEWRERKVSLTLEKRQWQQQIGVELSNH
jgi:hypothetical protein